MTLEWVLDGMASDTPVAGRPTTDVLYETFVAQGVAPEVARQMAEAAFAASGQSEADRGASGGGLVGEARERASASALRLAYATIGGRSRLTHPADSANALAKQRYLELYPPAIARGRFAEVELLERFPVLTAAFGYTRGAGELGNSVLQTFRDAGGGLRVHGQQVDTEALLFRLDPISVAEYLTQNGACSVSPSSDREAREWVAANCLIPQPGELSDPESPGASLLTLIHSYSHRILRRISGFCGIDRDSLAEYLVPEHLAFIIYATARGDFVLGGLQAVFEHDLDKVIDDVVDGEHRCALDPGCEKEGGACVACLHVGEPSCRYYNQYLDRATLFGKDGYLR
jgi:hypothetical protein